MHLTDLRRWQHTHTFGTDAYRPGERRTRWVIALTAAMMVVEIAAGTAFGSMALLADGWHMATHAAALGITAFAYAYARRRAHDPRYSFGTGKVGALGGFGSAVSLAVVAIFVLTESVGRLVSPVSIRFEEAIGVAIVGLAVNLASALLLRGDERHPGHGHGHAHGHAHEAAHAHDGHDHGHDHDHERGDARARDGDHRDHNLRGAYLHVVADALTSVLAIGALVTGKLLGWTWLDALTGVLGSILIARWSLGLLRDTSAVLLDAEVAPARRREVVAAIEADADNRVADLHLWRVGPRHLGAIVVVVTGQPRDPAHYRDLLRDLDDLAHVTVEVQRCQGPEAGTAAGDAEAGDAAGDAEARAAAGDAEAGDAAGDAAAGRRSRGTA